MKKALIVDLGGGDLEKHVFVGEDQTLENMIEREAARHDGKTTRVITEDDPEWKVAFAPLSRQTPAQKWESMKATATDAEKIAFLAKQLGLEKG